MQSPHKILICSQVNIPHFYCVCKQPDFSTFRTLPGCKSIVMFHFRVARIAILFYLPIHFFHFNNAMQM